MGVPLMNDRNAWGCLGIAILTILLGVSALMALATLFYR